jgi:hypothetical protein
MKPIYSLAIAAAVVLTSCSTYRQGQTPDDTYYSPARENRSGLAGGGRDDRDRSDYRDDRDDYVDANSGRSDGKRYYDDNEYSGYDDYATMNDRWLMMRVRNPYRWSAFDSYYYNSFSPYGGMYSPFYSPFYGSSFSYGWGGFQPGWSFGLGFGSFYNPWSYGYSPFYNHWNWNSYYNPYYPGVVIINPKTNPAGYTRARSFNLNRYNGNYDNRTGEIRPRYNNSNLQYNNNRTRYNNSNSSLEGSGRRYSNSNRNSYSSPSQDRPVRSYSPSSNNSYSPRSSGGSYGGGNNNQSSGGGGGSRPNRR